MFSVSPEQDQPATATRAKRNRATLSCGHCRFRKLKCDRSSPCGACLKAGDATTCVYTASRAPRAGNQRVSKRGNRDALSDRINRLESLLLSAVNGNPSTVGFTPPSEHTESSSDTAYPNITPAAHATTSVDQSSQENSLSNSFGIMKVEDGKSIFLGASHWASIMCEIKEFRSYLSENAEEIEHQAVENQASLKGSGHIPSLLQGTATPATKEELLSYVPSRVVADALVTQYFTEIWGTMPIIHETTFRREYIKHWDDPSKSSIMWLGLLFGMFNILGVVCDGFRSDVLDSEWKTRTIQCLIAGDYAHPSKYTLEALMMYVISEWMGSHDSNLEVYLVVGMTIRLAMRMGYHRNSRLYPISPFQGEMRSRIWGILRQMDVLISSQISLPFTVKEEDTDCPLPHNIYDIEFDENSSVIPPSRPFTEPTGLAYSIIKSRLSIAYGKVVILAERPGTLSHEVVKEYSQMLADLRQLLPPSLQIPPSGLKVGDPSLSQRIGMDRLLQTSQCILHRKFLAQARHDPDYAPYRRACIDAAMTLLSHQALMYLDRSAKSPFPLNVSRRHMSTLTTIDFFLAGMAVSLDLHFGFQLDSDIALSQDVELWGLDRRPAMIEALESCVEYWRLCKEDSIEAAKAFGMFSFVLSKFKNQHAVSNPIPAGLTEGVYEFTGANDPTMLEFDWDLWNKFNDIGTDIFGGFPVFPGPNPT